MRPMAKITSNLSKRRRSIIATPWTATRSLAAIRLLLVYWPWAGLLVCSMRSLLKIAATVLLWCGRRAIMPCATAPWGFVCSTPWRSAPNICSAPTAPKKFSSWIGMCITATALRMLFTPILRCCLFRRHQYPYYPGSGAANEVGSGAGEGFTINIPLPAGCADAGVRPGVSRYRRAGGGKISPPIGFWCPPVSIRTGAIPSAAWG